MKKILNYLIVILSCCFIFCSCSMEKNESTIEKENNDSEESIVEIEVPELTQIRSICKLATLECYYHNVAINTKAAGTGLTHLGEKDRQFWIEYTGKVKIGVDMYKGSINVDGTEVTVFIPEAEIMSIKLDPDSIQDPITDKDSLNSNKIDSSDITGAVDDAQTQIREKIENDSTLLNSARERAEKLIKNYIDQLGEASGIEYSVHFETINN